MTGQRQSYRILFETETVGRKTIREGKNNRRTDNLTNVHSVLQNPVGKKVRKKWGLGYGWGLDAPAHPFRVACSSINWRGSVREGAVCTGNESYGNRLNWTINFAHKLRDDDEVGLSDALDSDEDKVVGRPASKVNVVETRGWFQLELYKHSMCGKCKCASASSSVQVQVCKCKLSKLDCDSRMDR